MSDPRDIAEIERLKAWVADLQSGLYVNCVYCGHRYGPGETTPVAMADALKAHIARCPEHPMSELVKALTAASHALKSYACGNASPDLAKSIAEMADAALAKAAFPQRASSHLKCLPSNAVKWSA